MPEHNNTSGFILGYFENHGHPRYIISYKDTPQLRVSVAPQNILNWVSPRTFEEYEYTRTQLREGDDKGKAKAGPSQQVFEPRDESDLNQKGKPGRKRKYTVMKKGRGPPKSLIGPPSRVGRPRKSVDDSVVVSPQRPTLTSPSKQRGLADMVDSESEDDEDLHTDIAIEAQLNSTMAKRPRSRFGLDTVSETSSPEPASSMTRSGALTSVSRDTRSSSRHSRGSLSRSGSVSATGNETKRQRRSARH